MAKRKGDFEEQFGKFFEEVTPEERKKYLEDTLRVKNGR